MFKRLLQYSLYSFRKHKSSYVINIAGLSIGLASSLIIASFVIQETSYDGYHEKKNQIYRLVLDGKIGSQSGRTTATASITAPTIYSEYPEVEGFLRMQSLSGTIVSYNGNRFTEKNFLEADSSFFEFFSIPLIVGNPRTCLSSPRNVVISSSTAIKIFGTDQPMNKLLRIGHDSLNYTVTGIFNDIPVQTHFKADLISSFMTNPSSRSNQWMSNSFETYLLLNPNADPELLESKFPKMVDKYIGTVIKDFLGVTMKEFREQGNWYRFFLQPLTKIHLDPSIAQGLGSPTNPRYLYVFGSVALLIIIIAGINYVNLVTAQSTRRSKEIGIKKVCGSSKGLLIRQFLTESVVLSLVSLLIAVLIAILTLPYFSDLIRSELQLSQFNDGAIS